MAGGFGSFVADGNITPSRFVKPSTASNKVVIAGAGDATVGIAQEGTRNTPYASLDDGYAAIAGENVRVYIDNEVCYLESGAAITFGALLKSDSVGRGTPVTANNDFYGAQALQAAAGAGELIKAKVIRGYYGA